MKFQIFTIEIFTHLNFNLQMEVGEFYGVKVRGETHLVTKLMQTTPQDIFAEQNFCYDL